MRTALSTMTAALLTVSLAMVPLAGATGTDALEDFHPDEEFQVQPLPRVVTMCAKVYDAKDTLAHLISTEPGDYGIIDEAPVPVDTGADRSFVVGRLIPGDGAWDGNEAGNWTVQGNQVWDPVLQECVFTGEITVTCDCPGAFTWGWDHSVERDLPPTPDNQDPNVQAQGTGWEWIVTVPDPDVYEIEITTKGGLGGAHSVTFYATG